MDDDASLAEIVAAAGRGEQTAWDELVERYNRLLISIIMKYRLSGGQLEDVAQTVWLRLVEHLGSLREPEALPGWIVTTARRESLRMVTSERRSLPFDPQEAAELVDSGPGLDEELLRIERHEALLAGLGELPSKQRDLLLLLVADPPPSYAEISRRTGIPVGSIGPTRARALEKLRGARAMKQFTDHARAVEAEQR